ncbi:putative membrane protein [Carnobacterium iners]|uniref:Putative membrane protein n=1 Tax=Carnobacterium iners TaxID=1073423 RepID=A0A1X7N6B2_9LACT|nr:YhgE/Pip domain-containing protein [Carnobacterium iners]SEL28600.1 putative membrane protein [Carnobacterium iners]SMH32462.1 putative membrane protein [Carnobacterium iners]
MNMLKKEWKEVYSNKMLLLSCIVILFIPILYAGFFLKSNWDPYGSTDELSVAVVNEDEEVKYEGKKLAIGSELVSNLKNNDSLDWHFVAPSEAEKGLKDRTYYMVMTIPRNFSKDAATVMDAHPKKMKLTYKTNGSLNFIGEVISKSAVKEIKKEVSQNVTKAYTNALFDQVGEVGDGFAEAANGSNKLKIGTEKIIDGNKELTTNLAKLANSTLTFNEGADTLTIGVNQYTNGIAQLASGAVKLNEGINQLASNVAPIKDGVTQLDNGAKDLTSGLTTYTAGVSQLASGAGQLTANNDALQNGAISLSDGVDQVRSGSDQLLAGLNQLSTSLKASQSDKNKKNVDTLITSLPIINNGIQDLNTALGGQTESINTDSITEDLTSVGTNLKGMEESLIDAGTNLYSIGESTKALGVNVGNDATKTIGTVQNTTAFKALDSTQQVELLEALQGELKAQGEANAALLGTIANQTKTTGDAVTTIGNQATNISTSANELKNQLEELAGLTSQLTTLKTQVATLAAGSNQALPGAVQAITKLSGGLTSVQTALTQTGDGQNKGVIQVMAELNQGLKTIQGGLKDNDGLVAGITTYTNGVETLKDGATQLENYSRIINSGATQLSGGLSQVTGKLPSLIDGVDQLNTGSNQLVQGTKQLTNNSEKLINGSVQLANGAGQINEGSIKLANGSTTLGKGLGTLKEGTTTLATSLQEGATKVNAIDPTDETVNMFSNPTELIHKEFSHVPNYGAALAPYIMSMALYIGALVFNVIYPIRKQFLKGQSGFSFWLAKLSIALPTALLMAIIEGGILMALGLQVQSVGKFFAVAMITAVAFMAIVTFLTISLDNVGRFIAMILLVVQLGGSGGTFPIPLTNDFFIFIHPFLPMSYSIYGFREAISGGIGQDLYNQSMLVSVSITLVFSSLLFIYTYFFQKYKKQAIATDDCSESLPA